MTDQFDEAARKIAYDPAWHLDEDTVVYLRQDITDALRNTHNAAFEDAAMWHVRRVEFNRGARNADIRRRHQGYADALRTLKVKP